MTKKLTHEYVKKQIEGFSGYKLLSKEYINNKTKLSIQCPKNHVFQMKWNDFKMGKRCKKCSITKNTNSRKHSIKYIKDFIEKEGFALLSTEYKNSKSKLLLKCSNNHIVELSFNSFQQGKRCAKCYYKKVGSRSRHSIDYVKNYIENYEYSLISKEYKTVDTKLILICPKNHKFKITFHDFQRGHRCAKCSYKAMGERKKHDFEYVKNYIESRGYKLLSKTYVSSRDKIKLKCPKSHDFKIAFNNFKQGQRCGKCAGTAKLEYEFVKQRIESAFNYKLLSNEYTNGVTPLIIQCSEGHIYKSSYENFDKGRRCPNCAKSAFKKDFPASLYYLKINLKGKSYYKIGVTNRNINDRIKEISLVADILWTEEYLFGQYAYEKEQKILKKYSNFLANDSSLPIASGYTELFIKDVLKKDIFDE